MFSNTCKLRKEHLIQREHIWRQHRKSEAFFDHSQEKLKERYATRAKIVAGPAGQKSENVNPGPQPKTRKKTGWRDPYSIGDDMEVV